MAISWKQLRDRLEEYNADIPRLLNGLEEIQVMSLEGVEQEKVSAKDGVMTVLERYPDVARRAIMDKFAILQYIEEKAEAEKTEQIVEYVIHVQQLEVA